MPPKGQYRPRRDAEWHRKKADTGEETAPYMPTLEQIAADVAELQEGKWGDRGKWDDEERHRRADIDYDPNTGGKPVELVPTKAQETRKETH